MRMSVPSRKNEAFGIKEMRRNPCGEKVLEK